MHRKHASEDEGGESTVSNQMKTLKLLHMKRIMFNDKERRLAKGVFIRDGADKVSQTS